MSHLAAGDLESGNGQDARVELLSKNTRIDWLATWIFMLCRRRRRAIFGTSVDAKSTNHANYIAEQKVGDGGTRTSAGSSPAMAMGTASLNPPGAPNSEIDSIDSTLMQIRKAKQDRNRAHRAMTMAMMLRHISGKRDFDLFATPVTSDRFFAISDLKEILKDFTTKRVSAPAQKRLSEHDSTMHFHDVSLDLLFETVEEYGYAHGCLEDAVLEVLSHRSDYQSNLQMQDWMAENLLHVKYDLTAEGNFKVGDRFPIDDPILYSLDNLAPCSLLNFFPSDGKPIVILAGSWS